MSETEIVAELATRTQMIWNYIQWWSSISLAIIAAGYLTSERQLALPILITLFTVYTLYSCMMLMALGAQAGFIGASVQALKDLDADGTLSPLGRYAMEEIDSDAASVRAWVIRITLGVVYWLTILYPLYTFWQSHRGRVA